MTEEKPTHRITLVGLEQRVQTLELTLKAIIEKFNQALEVINKL